MLTLSLRQWLPSTTSSYAGGAMDWVFGDGTDETPASPSGSSLDDAGSCDPDRPLTRTTCNASSAMVVRSGS